MLRLLREGSARFLSDDMTILSSHGCAQSFPKPVMISQATLRAVDAADLSPLQWRWLRVQSRFSSREGRGIAAWLGERNLPIMSLDAVAQHLFPTLRYPVQRLVPCETATKVSVSELFVLERGADDLAPIPPDSLVHELIEGTDNAYGFPPFRYFAPALEIGGAGYDELRARERCILAEAMRHVRAHRLTSPDFSWAARIAQLTGDRSGTR